ncbi:plasmid recombination enzyme (plasmid) [Enterococcus faecalis]|uniref:plasmid recombination protein n=1 Tax=Enterococcus faecalis TaxID=1351 RepID=UPI00097E3907|nr:plasmid recombination protein [Enterococcus faecalis]AQL55329.1 plasmid recombination enzyme [Enterococcus faecalis]HAP5201453.1 plasmid recombination protein [Enterococcus faecalis]HAP5201716.1 plasmid recombination protein [Enterococcus faecalis]HAP5211369.1 plasmid recombination protein [Enterococcus faecalis]HAP5211529.1 plasmid recombination protein [Enterococcus faecalis]
MSMSVSFKKATNKTNIKHNNRDFTEKQKAQNSHIDFSKSDENKILVQKDLRELYEQEFSEPLKNYNDKQKRNDRKIDDYCQHIKDSKKTSLQQEMIIQVGDKDDFNSPEDFERANEVLEDWFSDFEERNPNLKVYNAIIHNDEASPHLHLNFVPVADGYKRGLEKQVSFDRAIKQQDQTLNKTRPFQDWREKEVDLIADKLKERGIERKLVGTNDYKDVNDYKIKKDLEREIKTLEKDLSQKKNELVNLTNEKPKKISLKSINAKYEMKTIDKPTGKKLLGVPLTEKKEVKTGNIVLPEEEFLKLRKSAQQNQQLKAQMEKYLTTDLAKENRELRKKNEVVKNKYNDLVERFNSNVRNYNELLEENISLKGRVKDLTNEIGSIYKSVKEFLKERTDDLRAFKSVFNDLVDKVKGKTPKGEFERLNKQEKRKEMNRGMKR